MLNWAVAEALAGRIEDEGLGLGLAPAEAESLLGSVRELSTRNGERIGTRLGYVYFDALWLVAGSCAPEFVAELVWRHVSAMPHEHRDEATWRDGIGSIGPRLLPALERLAARVFDEDQHWDIPRPIPTAFAAIAVADPKAVEAVVARLLASGDDRLVTIGLRTAALVPAPTSLDAIWCAHLDRARVHAARAVDATADSRMDAIHRLELSSKALKRAIGADPAWLDARLGTETEPVAVDQLLWLLKDEQAVDGDFAAELWSQPRRRTIAAPQTTSALWMR